MRRTALIAACAFVLAFVGVMVAEWRRGADCPSHGAREARDRAAVRRRWSDKGPERVARDSGAIRIVGACRRTNGREACSHRRGQAMDRDRTHPALCTGQRRRAHGYPRSLLADLRRGENSARTTHDCVLGFRAQMGKQRVRRAGVSLAHVVRATVAGAASESAIARGRRDDAAIM